MSCWRSASFPRRVIVFNVDKPARFTHNISVCFYAPAQSGTTGTDSREASSYVTLGAVSVEIHIFAANVAFCVHSFSYLNATHAANTPLVP